ncbi:hypothetical protein FKW77_008199 [Venturia effusa]|uniref:Uncharacterized protein n=1 Tax=Venturia effusa TaxID=50376 RepID=A0A517LE98_9PEZI|nr:hypothetical protein FKW77_008199 [Venturia effusa]
MSSGYDKYSCCYYDKLAGPHDFVEVKGNACATCLSGGKGHQGASMSLRANNITIKRQRSDIVSTPHEWFGIQAHETAGPDCKIELSTGKPGEGPLVAYTPHHRDARARRLSNIEVIALDQIINYPFDPT